jgi:hypothetical protein
VDRAWSPDLVPDLSSFISIDRVPDYVQYVLVVEALEDAITAEDDKIMKVGL